MSLSLMIGSRSSVKSRRISDVEEDHYSRTSNSMSSFIK